MKTLTIGTWDLCHVGHLNLLRHCEQLAGPQGEILVGINSDEFVLKYKGKKPIMNEVERSKFIGTLGYRVILNTSEGRDLIERYKPDYLVIGSDWLRKDYLRQIDVTVGWLEQAGVSLVYVPYTWEISSSEIRRRVELQA